MSLAARLLNVFAVPGQVFNDVKTAPSSISNWLIPALLGGLIGAVSVFIILSQPKVQKQFQDRQSKLLEEAARNSKFNQTHRQWAETLTTPATIRLLGTAGAACGSFLTVLWWGFVLWLLARRMLKVPIKFRKALEVAGLATMIDVLGGIVIVLLIVNLGRHGSTSSLAFVVKDLDMTTRRPLFVAAVNLFAFWVVGVRSIGLAKLTEVPYVRAAWLVVTFWLLQQCFFSLTGLGQLAI